MYMYGQLFNISDMYSKHMCVLVKKSLYSNSNYSVVSLSHYSKFDSNWCICQFNTNEVRQITVLY